MLLGLVIAASAVTPVNDANWVSFGGAGAFVPHKTIRMLGEDINITIYDDKIHVRVWFSFRNDGPETTVTMAFPFETVAYSDPIVKRFASKVDGEAVATTVVSVPPFNKSVAEWAPEGYISSYVYTKEVHFAAGQRRFVLVDYVTDHGYFGAGYHGDEYILHTGSTWAGTIGNITISVDWSNTKRISRPDLVFRRQDFSEFEAEWTHIDSRHATISLKDVEPDFDLDLGSILGFWNVWVDGRRLYYSRGYSDVIGPNIKGDLEDPLFYIGGLGEVFQEWAIENGFEKSKYRRTPKVVSDVPDLRTVVLTDGRRLELARPIVTWNGKVPERPSSSCYMYLRDILEAIGGSYSYNPTLERVDIEMPHNSD